MNGYKKKMQNDRNGPYVHHWYDLVFGNDKSPLYIVPPLLALVLRLEGIKLVNKTNTKINCSSTKAGIFDACELMNGHAQSDDIERYIRACRQGWEVGTTLMYSPVRCGNIRWDYLAIRKDKEHNLISQLPKILQVKGIPQLCCAEALDTALIAQWLWKENHNHDIIITINDQESDGFSPTVRDLNLIPHLLFRSVVRWQQSDTTQHNTRGEEGFEIWINERYYDYGTLKEGLRKNWEITMTNTELRTRHASVPIVVASWGYDDDDDTNSGVLAVVRQNDQHDVITVRAAIRPRGEIREDNLSVQKNGDRYIYTIIPQPQQEVTENCAGYTIKRLKNERISRETTQYSDVHTLKTPYRLYRRNPTVEEEQDVGSMEDVIRKYTNHCVHFINAEGGEVGILCMKGGKPLYGVHDDTRMAHGLHCGPHCVFLTWHGDHFVKSGIICG